jgi:tetratricopeptide (TPR) repeat protein
MKRSDRRKQAKKRERAKRLAKERNLRRNEPQFEPYYPADDAPFAQERLERRFALLVLARGARTEEEITALLAEVADRPWHEVAAEEFAANQLEQAQELAYCAMETPDDDEALDLAEEALELDEFNCDARRVLLSRAEAPPTPENALEELFSIVEDGAQALGGDEVFRAVEGQLGSLVTARGYLRARGTLALALREAKRDDEARHELQDILTLDSEDSLNVRFALLSLLLRDGDRESASALLARFAQDSSDAMAWSRLLFAWPDAAPDELAERLRAARAANPLVERLVLEPDGVDLDDPRFESAEAVTQALELDSEARRPFADWLRAQS